MSSPVRRLALCAATLAVAAAPLASVPSLAAPSAAATAPGTPATPHLWAPTTSTGVIFGRREMAQVPLGVRLVAGADPLEVWSTRSSYTQPIRSVVRTAAGDETLPANAMPNFGGLRSFLTVTATDARTGEVVRTTRRNACLNASSVRARPEAPARSPYPEFCFANPYALGTVQGVQSGWSSSVLDHDGAGLWLPRGRYVIEVAVRPTYAAALGIAPADATRTIRAVVKRQPRGHHDHDDHPHSHRGSTASVGTASPAGTDGPSGRRVAARDEIEGPVPNLRALPAWGIDVSRNGDFLRFSATVWNAGDSPLVVDGFSADQVDRMDAYQYFFDADGNQTGYAPVGSFEFDRKPTHQHWHFRDFATYTLLRADKTTAVTSRKEAFCLANTDAVDLTVPDADWRPYNTDLSTDCGYEGSRSMRQVLSAGWGDTYAQFRAGQSFNLRELPNGTYYIATIANPRHRLVESSTDDNVALRRVVIGGTPGRRTVRVPQVGLVVEPSHAEAGFSDH